MKALRNLTDEQLCELYGTADEATQDAIRIECDRRDARDRQRARDAAEWNAVVAEWMDWAHAQYLAAEAECRGHMLSKAGKAAGINPQDLWSGRADVAAKYASEELLEFWAAHPRMTRTQYRDWKAQQRRAERMALAA